MTIEEVELRLEQGLSRSLESYLHPLLPEGYRPRVHLHEKTGRKKRKDARAESWSPDSGEVRICFEREACSPSPSSQEKPVDTPADTSVDSSSSPTMGTPISDLVRALDRAESRPGYDFIALKWFRDVFLPAQGFDWTKSDSSRQDVLRDAIEKRLILTSKVPNPKSPQFPVTAIRLNRLLADNQAILRAGQGSDSGFNPVEIRGENLSTTILRERR